MQKRFFLSLSCLALIASGPSRSRAAAEVEAAGYTGTTAGGWACGPIGRANYAGGAARVRVAEETATRERGAGWVAESSAAVEHERTTIIDCDQSCEDPRGEQAPPDSVLGGATVRVGHHFKRFGVEVGGQAFQGFNDNTHESPSVALIPTVELSGGVPTKLRAVAGVGSPMLTTARRPGAYVGADANLEAVQLELRAGMMRQGPSMLKLGPRLDGVVLVPVSDAAAVRLGASGGVNEADTLDAEGSIGARLNL